MTRSGWWPGGRSGVGLALLICFALCPMPTAAQDDAAEQEARVPHAVVRYTDFEGNVSYASLDAEAFASLDAEVADEARYLRQAIREARDTWRRKHDGDDRDRYRDRQGRNRSTVTVSTGSSFPQLRVTRPALRKMDVYPDEAAAAEALAVYEAEEAERAERATRRLTFRTNEDTANRREEAAELVRDELRALVRKAQRERERGGFTGGRLGNTAADDTIGLGESGSRRKHGLSGGGSIRRLGED